VTDRPKRSVFRRIERWLVGLAMAVVAFVLERMVLRSIKKGRIVPTRAVEEEEPPFATSQGTDVTGG
jgi:hypothetical protein